MKKLRLTLISILSLIAILFSVTTVLAKDNEYNLKDLGLSIRISDTLDVKTRATSTLPEGIYLEATNEDNSLRISIAMDKNETTEEVDSFANQSSYYLDEIKLNLENEGVRDIKDATYGSVPFLDYMQTIETEDSKDEILELHSITCVNGMTIAIVSQTTPEQVSVINDALQSIHFDIIEKQPATDTNTEEEKNSALPAIIFICGGVVLAIVVIFIVKKRIKAKAVLLLQQQIEKKNNALDSDFAVNAAEKKNIGGYRTSSDYFDEGFDKPTANKAPAEPAEVKSKSNKPGVFKRMGYFKKNLQKQINSSKKSKNKVSKTAKRKTVDYDIFNEK